MEHNSNNLKIKELKDKANSTEFSISCALMSHHQARAGYLTNHLCSLFETSQELEARIKKETNNLVELQSKLTNFLLAELDVIISNLHQQESIVSTLLLVPDEDRGIKQAPPIMDRLKKQEGESVLAFICRERSYLEDFKSKYCRPASKEMDKIELELIKREIDALGRAKRELERQPELELKEAKNELKKYENWLDHIKGIRRCEPDFETIALYEGRIIYWTQKVSSWQIIFGGKLNQKRG